MQHCFSHDDSSTSFVLRQPECLWPSHTMKTATQSYALRLIAESVAAPRTDFESCVKSQAVGPRENPCNFCRSVASDGKKRFSTLFGDEREINQGSNQRQRCAPTPEF